MVDAVLAIAHHLAVFSLAAIIAMESILLRAGLAGPRIRDLARIDAGYGIVAGVVIVVGVLRVIFGDRGYAFYVYDWTFWAKMAAFAAAGLLSIQPTINIVRWRKALSADPAFVPPADAIARSQSFLRLEVGFFLLIPVFAALMARGIGL
jgi:putative membrane protein